MQHKLSELSDNLYEFNINHKNALKFCCLGRHIWTWTLLIGIVVSIYYCFVEDIHIGVAFLGILMCVVIWWRYQYGFNFVREFFILSHFEKKFPDMGVAEKRVVFPEFCEFYIQQLVENDSLVFSYISFIRESFWIASIVVACIFGIFVWDELGKAFDVFKVCIVFNTPFLLFQMYFERKIIKFAQDDLLSLKLNYLLNK